MANSKDLGYESSTLASTILVRLRAAEAAVYTPAAGDIAFNLHAFNGSSRKRFGIHARGAKIKRLVGTVPNQQTIYGFLPFGTQAALDALAINSTITIANVAWTVVSKVLETSV